MLNKIFIPLCLLSLTQFSFTLPSGYDLDGPFEDYQDSQRNPYTSNRRTKDLLVPGSHVETEITRRMSNSKRFQDDENLDADGRPYNANLLNQFLEEYAEKVKNMNGSNATSKRKGEEVSVDRKTGPSDTLNLKNGYVYDTVHRKNPYTSNKNGWVTMDPVPWSTSKISKWQSKPVSQNFPPNLDRFSSHHYDKRPNRRPISNSNIVTRPDPDYDEDFGNQGPYGSNRPFNDRPFNDRPGYGDIRPPELEYDADIPSRPYAPPRPSNANRPCDDHKYPTYESDIVTDGLPGAKIKIC